MSRDRRLTLRRRREQDYALRKSLWAWSENRIAVRSQYEWHDENGRWSRTYGNENGEFDADGYIEQREASINDVAIADAAPDLRAAARVRARRPGPLPLR